MSYFSLTTYSSPTFIVFGPPALPNKSQMPPLDWQCSESHSLNSVLSVNCIMLSIPLPPFLFHVSWDSIVYGVAKHYRQLLCSYYHGFSDPTTIYLKIFTVFHHDRYTLSGYVFFIICNILSLNSNRSLIFYDFQ